ncbi:MAG: hypothetical protein JWN40_4101 [Phycisphaerales bacterium]|nr:hypothetical protein [Phycisphaerales bacterium]
MSIKTPCISCGRTLSAPDNAAGKRARCPSCGTIQQLPGNQPPPESDILEPEAVEEPAYDAPPADPFAEDGAPSDEYAVAADAPPLPTMSTSSSNEQRKPCPMCGEMIAPNAPKCPFCGEIFDPRLRASGAGANIDHPGWLTVRKGLRMVYVSITIIFVAAIGMGCLAGALSSGRRGGGPDATMGILVILPALVILGAAIAIIIGQFMCCAVPAETGAKNFAMIAAICIIVNIICSVAAVAVPPAQALGSIASLTGNILFILFLRKVALYLGNHELASSAMGFLVFLIVVVVVAVLIGVGAAMSGTGAAVGLLGLLIIVGALVGLVWYMRLLKRTVETIDARGSSTRRSGFPVIQR